MRQEPRRATIVMTRRTEAADGPSSFKILSKGINMARKPRIPTKHSSQDDKRSQALELCKAGATFERIAQELGYASTEAAYGAVMAALKETLREPAAQIRKLARECLDRLQVAVWPWALNGDTGGIDRWLQIAKQQMVVERRNITKVDPTDATGEKEFSGGLTDEERMARVAALFDRARTRRDGQAAESGASAPVDPALRPPDAGVS
jgi:hypothetical protein